MVVIVGTEENQLDTVCSDICRMCQPAVGDDPKVTGRVDDFDLRQHDRVVNIVNVCVFVFPVSE